MAEVNIEIKNVAAREDIQRWEDHMLVKAKCWNQFCDGLYTENEIRAVHVVKEDNTDTTYLTTLCEDLEINAADIEDKLAAIDYHYDQNLNRFA